MCRPIRQAILMLSLIAPAAVYAQQNSAERVRTFAALPNWTGLWETDASATFLAGAGTPADPTPGPADALPEVFRHIVLLGTPPYNADWQKRSAKARDKAQKTQRSGKPPPDIPACSAGLFGGFPAVMDSPVPDDTFEAVATPEETLFVFPDGTVRHIYTDRRSHPKPDDLWPTSLGDSIGHWDGATLVVDTIARKAGPILPMFGDPNLSEQAHFIERIRRVDSGTMENRMTIDDPLRFTHPWQITITYKRVTDLDRMIETNCTENDRNPIVKGHFTLK